MEMNHLSTSDQYNILEEVYNTIVSGGKNKVDGAEVTGFKLESTTANRLMNQHREVHFKGAKNWIEYQKAYGQADIYKAISDYVDSASIDIASMQVFGPNPTNVFNKLMEKAAKDGKDNGFTEHLEGMFDVATGKTDSNKASTTTEKTMASGAGTFRSLGVASDLGGAVISSVTDPVLSGLTAAHIGMSPLGTFISQMGTIGRRIANGFNVSEKEMFAQRIGIVQDSFMASIRNNRFSEGGGSVKAQKLADGVLRSSGLMAWTNALRTTFALEMSGMIADNIGKNLMIFILENN